LALAALRWHGYRSEKRYIVFQALAHTLKLPAEQWRVLDDAHRRRNIAEYEGVVDVDQALLDAVLRVPARSRGAFATQSLFRADDHHHSATLR
jgi:hypothetical protein